MSGRRPGSGAGHRLFLLTPARPSTLPGLDRPTAQALLDAAHQICPYSKATRNNIDATVRLA